MHQTREGDVVRVPDPEYLTEEERVAILDDLQAAYGFVTH